MLIALFPPTALRALLVALCLAACTEPLYPPTHPDAAPVVAADAASAAAPDAASVADAASAPTGFGTISGPCGVLAQALTATTPATFTNHIDFATDPYDASDYALLTEGGQEIIDDGNAGGSSLFSEVFAFEVLNRCDRAELLKTETEILYDPPQGRITDLLVSVGGMKLGVSVTRAVAFPFDQPYPPDRARTLMTEKLSGIIESTGHVAPADAWSRQLLSVIAYAPAHVPVLEAALASIDPAVRGDTIVLITVTDGDDAFLY